MSLPLPLVPFEEYMLVDDRPAYPTSFFVRGRFAGRFDRTALDAALSVAISRHPLLAAVAQRSGRRWVWQPVAGRPVVEWLDSLPAESLPRLEPLDVRAAPGIRVVAGERHGRTDIVLQVHHACCDGLGILRFIEDLLISYASACGATPKSALRRLQPERLRGRGKFGLTASKLPSLLRGQAVGLLGVRQFLMRRPEPLVPHVAQADDSPLPPDYPASQTRQLDRDESAGILPAARQLGVSANDLLLRDVFLALNDWRQRHAPDRCHGWVRLAVPVSLRTMADRRLPAANVVSMVFLDRTGPQMADSQHLLNSIHEEIELIKRLHLGLTFVLSLGVARWLPGGLHRMAYAGNCMSSSVLTNFGTVLDRCPLPYEDGRLVVGEAVLEGIDALPLLRPLTCASIGLLNYAGRLHVTVHYDPRVLVAADASELIDGFTARVRQSVGVRGPVAVEAGR
jgi:NRPS condensation-like uncharacterized protein